MIPELIYCAGGNKRFADIAIRYGFTYGAQMPSTVYHAPEFIDQNWKNPRRREYMLALKKHQPRLCTVLDLERPDQYETVIGWMIEAYWYTKKNLEAMIVIPKFSGAIECLLNEERIKHIPLRFGYSVPTKYGGTTVPLVEFANHPVHALGGSPQEQIRLAKIMNVQSVDGNYIQKIALWNQYLNGDTLRFQRIEHTLKPFTVDANYCAFEISCIVLKNAWNGHALNFRSATESDIGEIKQIADQQKKELGFVNKGMLLKSIAGCDVVVATISHKITGFVHYYSRKDGRQTIYEIAVHPDYRGMNIGKGLLACVPKPIQLKVTTDNERAIGFYLSQGFIEIAQEQGRKRPLLVLRKER